MLIKPDCTEQKKEYTHLKTGYAKQYNPPNSAYR